MYRVRPLRAALLGFAGAAIVGCGSDGITKPKAPEPNFIRLVSDAGDYIGAGSSYEYTQANAELSVRSAGAALSVQVNGDEWWYGEFAGPSADTLIHRGTYANLTRHPFHNRAAGGLSWWGEGRGCNTLTGSFTVDDVTYIGDSLTAIDLRFEQRCEGGAHALRGSIHWRADDTTKAAGPTAIPAGLWQPPSGIVPATGDYVYLQSDQGDFIGYGGNYLYEEPTNPITVASNGGRHISVSVAGWGANFATMNSIPRLQQGYYGGLSRYYFHNPRKGGLDWWGHGRGCNTLSGWFVVDRVTYTGVTLTALELRFEQHCEEVGPALRGKLRWSA